MAEVRMCDCCEEIVHIEEMNDIDEVLISDIDGQEFVAINEVCDDCLQDMVEQVGYQEDEDFDLHDIIDVGRFDVEE